ATRLERLQPGSSLSKDRLRNVFRILNRCSPFAHKPKHLVVVITESTIGQVTHY
ncbi:MAG: hypothetical protein QOJ71_2877, partial [Actinomycetota bacterium]|nr:hypothetical protein [Actinomycetota bacterium]